MDDRAQALALARQIEHDASLAWALPLVREFLKLVEAEKKRERRDG